MLCMDGKAGTKFSSGLYDLTRGGHEFWCTKELPTIQKKLEVAKLPKAFFSAENWTAYSR